MKTITMIRGLIAILLALTSPANVTLAQEISIPDPGLNAAIREALGKPVGPLTGQDLLGLTELNAEARNIRSLQGLEAATNLTVLELRSNRLSNLSLPTALKKLNLLDLSLNPLTNCFLPAGLTNLAALVIEEAELTSLSVPGDMRALTVLDLYGNRLGNLNLPGNLARLDFVELSANGLTNLNLPPGLKALTELRAWGNGLTSLSLPDDMTNLVALTLFFNQLTNLTVPAGLRTLSSLELDGNRFTSFNVPSTLARLSFLNLRDNLLTNLNLPAGMSRLSFLDLEGNRLRNITLPAGLTQLDFLRLSGNQLTSLALPTGLTNLSVIFLRFNQLTNLTLPPDLTRLVQIDLLGNQLGSLALPPDMMNLSALVLDGNPLTTLILSEPLAATTLFGTVASLRNRGVSVITFPLAEAVSIPDPGLNAAIREALQRPTGTLTDQDLLSLTNLDAGFRDIRSVEGLERARHLERLILESNRLTNFSLPGALTNLIELHLSDNPLTNCSLPAGLAKLDTLNIGFCSLTQLSLPVGLTALSHLGLGVNALSSFTVPADATNLVSLSLFFNQLTNLTLPSGLTHLGSLDLDDNELSRLTLPPDMTNLAGLLLRNNQLREFFLPVGLSRLNFLALDGNRLTEFTFPAGLTNLSFVGLTDNQLTSLTLPPDMTQLDAIFVNGNPFTTLVLSEPLAAANLAGIVAFLRNQGISVLTYPLVPQLVRPRHFPGRFQFGITGPPGAYTVEGSTNLADWEFVGTANNPLGSINFNHVTADVIPHKFYRVLQQPLPMNMVFIPPNTFAMGSPPTELHRQTNEGPQTTVTLTRGFWIGKYEVTQGEYLSVMSTNPSQFPGDLSRPVSSVSWPDATNYCWNLTRRELAAGRLSPGAQYRLPTEAEWECAARAGTTTRFSYGDDLDSSQLMNYAWQTVADGLTVHPVGQKLPNPWGLYDTMGNVLEWCQDWLGPLPGGHVNDPVGPDSNPMGWKIMRGSAFDFGDCRSASRMFFPNHPALTDWNLGFRVVLVIGSGT